jgi:hypothetical protein
MLGSGNRDPAAFDDPPALPEHVLMRMAHATADAMTERIGRQFKARSTENNDL